MRKLLFLSAALLVLSASFATSNVTIKPRLKASEIMIPIGNGQQVSVLDLSQMSIKEVEAIRGEKMKFVDRMAFKAAQHKLRNNINPDGTLSNKLVKKTKKFADGDSGFHFGGFALGFFLGLIGVLVAYLINDDLKSSRVKWAWLGLLIGVALSIIVFVLI